MLIDDHGNMSIHRITTVEDVHRFRAGFIGAYQTVFSGFPYFERFFPNEAEGVYRKLTGLDESVILVAVRGETQVVAFAAAIPLAAKEDVAAHLTGLVPLRHTYYLAELGVLEPYRNRGLGKVLIRQRIQAMDPQRYSHVVLRVSMNNNPSKDLYESLGFEEMGVHMDVSSMRVDGKVTTDRRMFMSRVRSQVNVATP